MSATVPLVARQSSAPLSGTDEFLLLISDPFSSQLQSTSIYAGFVLAIVATLVMGILFCLLRPHIPPIYAPRLRAADEQHAPPPLGKGLFDWIRPIRTTAEMELIEKIGLDAALFLRFTRMCRNIFICLTIVGCSVIIPINLAGNHDSYPQYGQVAVLMKFTPQYIYGSAFWAYVIVYYVFAIIICYFLWYNYRVVVRLRKSYFESDIYQTSLHSRTLMVSEIPKDMRTDDGIVRIVETVKPVAQAPSATIARNVRDLPILIEEYEEAVKEFESVLAKYLKNPEQVPAQRPTCKPSKKDSAHNPNSKVDAIDYYTLRIRQLEKEIVRVRHSLDQRNPLAYGFASYVNIADAHGVAHAAQKRKSQGAIVRLAPKPNDLIWKNLSLTPKDRKSREWANLFWFLVLTIIYVPFNALSAIFLSNFHNLGAVWPAFNASLDAHSTIWGIVQGILSPAIQTGIYIALPIIFRRLRNRAGDTTKTSRERHVANKLFSFFVFNNLIVFSVFSTVFAFVSSVVKAKHDGFWDTIEQAHPLQSLVTGLCNVSPFWVTWLLQRNLGATADLLQIWPLIWRTLMRKFSNPTPRELIELTAPPTFEYAEYYNYFLFYVTVTLCYSTLQPLVLPVTAVYFCIDAWLKKYLFLYVVITKTESAGAFWKILFNRVLFATIFGVFIVALLTGARTSSWQMPVALVPLLVLLIGFKYYCARQFDEQLYYYSTRTTSDFEPNVGGRKRVPRNDRVAVRFGNPALYKQLMTPMVNANAQHLLKAIFRGHLEDNGGRPQSAAGFSDIYMAPMSQNRPGKSVDSFGGAFEFVSENDMDFENFKKRAEFREQFGGDGELYGRAQDFVSSRPTTPSTFTTFDKFHTRNESGGSPSHSQPGSQSHSREMSAAELDNYPQYDGTTYPTGYHQAPPTAGQRESSPGPNGRWGSVDITARQYGSEENIHGRLTQYAAPMGNRGYSPSGGVDATPLVTPGYPVPQGYAAPHGYSPSGGIDATPLVTPGQHGGQDGAYMPTPEEDTSYDYFRRGRRY